jgi:hypothetical protein
MKIEGSRLVLISLTYVEVLKSGSIKNPLRANLFVGVDVRGKAVAASTFAPKHRQ